MDQKCLKTCGSDCCTFKEKETSASNNTLDISEKRKKVLEARRRATVPKEILNDPEIERWVKKLPQSYNFEIYKCIWHIKQKNAKRVALQFPEGLITFSLTISEILERFTNVDIIIMGDVSYGACCIDDFTASIYDCDFIIHFGHSCLVPIDVTDNAHVLYVFVEIKIDVDHFVDTLLSNFDETKYLAFITTIQFVSALNEAANKLKTSYNRKVLIPQTFPLSRGEILGCTAPKLPPEITDIIYLGDGRFHIESLMIQSPEIPAFKYDPYTKKISQEFLSVNKIVGKQHKMVLKAQFAKINKIGRFGIIMGTLGRQGNIRVLNRLIDQITESGLLPPLVIFISELLPEKLYLFSNDISVWSQITCPRLSIDWSESFDKPILTTYELSVVTGHIKWNKNYPMDYYASDSLGPWTPNHKFMVNSKLKIHNEQKNTKIVTK